MPRCSWYRPEPRGSPANACRSMVPSTEGCVDGTSSPANEELLSDAVRTQLPGSALVLQVGHEAEFPIRETATLNPSELDVSPC